MRLTILTALLALVMSASAQANMSIGMQDDDSLMADATTYLGRADYARAQWIRIMVPDARWYAGQADAYVNVARRAHEDGKRVLASMLTWHRRGPQHGPTASTWARYTATVVQRMAPYVDAWSPMNEPNQENMMPRSNACPMTYRTITRTTRNKRVRFKRMQRRHWHFKRVVRHGTIRYRYLRKRRGYWRKRTVWASVTTSRVVRIKSVCDQHKLGRAYRAVWNSSAPVIKRLDPTAQIIAGDLMPYRCKAFMDGFYASGQPSVWPSALGVHPYLRGAPDVREHDGDWRLSGIEDAAAYARAHGTRLWATEWSYWPKLAYRIEWWPAALRRMERAGVRVTMIYDARALDGHWNTRMTPAVLKAIHDR